MYQTVQYVLGGIALTVFGLSALSRRLPHVAWLQLFRFNAPQLSEAQRVAQRRRSNVHAGIEMILMGLALPIVYLASTVMFFNDPKPLGIALTAGGSILLIAFGVAAIWKRNQD